MSNNGQVPERIGQEDFMVVFSGATAKDQIDAKQKYVRVRHQTAMQFVDHLISKNVAYTGELDGKTTSKNDDLLHGMGESVIDEDLVIDEGLEGNLINKAYSDTDRVSDGVFGSTTSIDSSSGLFHFSKVSPKVPTTVEEVSGNTQSNLKHLRVVNSNFYLEESDPSYYGSAFPHLFSYGIGTPNCKRPVCVSVEEGLKHLLSLSDRKFGTDDVFVLAGFDRLARSKAVARMYIKLKSDARTAADAVEVTKEQMIALLNHNKEVKKALRSGRICPHIPDDLKNARRVLRSVESVASSTYGTEEERLKMRAIVHGYTQVTSWIWYLIRLHYTGNEIVFTLIGIWSTVVNGHSDS
jgi:hypothetical protein